MCQKPHLSLIGIGCPAQSPCYGELEVLVLAAFESDKASDKEFTGKLVYLSSGWDQKWKNWMKQTLQNRAGCTELQ